MESIDSFQYKNKAVSIKFFSEQTNIPVIEIIKYFFLRGIEMNLNSWLNEKLCKELCLEFGLKFLKEDTKSPENIYLETILSEEDINLEWIKKDPVVVIMGHVNHGKTTLLDKIRKTKVAEKEYANITQHISSYQVTFQNNQITFLDTPGHEIFSKLRSIGGVIANIIVLVIAIDDGVQAQTKEIIEYYKKHKLKLIVFINKVDKTNNSLENIKKQLTDEDIELEEYGGDVILLKGSAKTGLGINELLETISLVAEVEDYKTTLSPPVIGVILESKIEKGLGAMAEIITIRGHLKTGDYIAGEDIFCKIKTIFDEEKNKIKSLSPSKPASISGFEKLPPTGKKFFSFATKEEALAHFNKLKNTKDEKYNQKDDSTLSKRNDPTHFSFIIKSRVSGSSEAIQAFILKFNYSVIAIGSGEISEEDIKLASIKNAIIINFEQRISKRMEEQLNFLNITYWKINSIYELEEKIIEHREKHRRIEKIEKILGRCKVIRLWTHSKVGTIAGCSVISGKIQFNDKVRLIREGNQLTKTTIKSFKIENFEVKEAIEGQECGIVLNNWNNIELEDVIESYEIIEKKI